MLIFSTSGKVNFLQVVHFSGPDDIQKSQSSQITLGRGTRSSVVTRMITIRQGGSRGGKIKKLVLLLHSTAVTNDLLGKTQVWGGAFPSAPT